PANNRIEEFDSSFNLVNSNYASSALTTAFGTGLRGTAISMDTNDHLFVEGTRSASSQQVAVAELDNTGSLVDVHGQDLTETNAAQVPAIAIAPATRGGNLYAASNETGKLQGVYVLSDAVPTMDPVTVHTGTTATFSGSVASKGFDTSYHFEYSTDGTNWTSFPASDVDAGTDPGSIPVSQAVSHLVGDETYHVRLVQ